MNRLELWTTWGYPLHLPVMVSRRPPPHTLTRYWEVSGLLATEISSGSFAQSLKRVPFRLETENQSPSADSMRANVAFSLTGT
jgi:hypothetical protein